MKKRAKRSISQDTRQCKDRIPDLVPAKRSSLTTLVALSAMAVGIAGALWVAFNRFYRSDTYTSAPRFLSGVTFHKDIAPILRSHCAGCHRPGQAAPFSLLTYDDVKKRAKQIAEVTAKRVMPPWLPEPGYGEFANERRLTIGEIEAIQNWIAQGAVEGVGSALPPAPFKNDGWQLGQPDLVVKMSKPYTLKADGPDVYRNFVIPIPVASGRYVQAVEFRPGNSKIVHHAFIKVDASGESRRLDEQDIEPGFSFMLTPGSAQIPEGHFLSWNPGYVPAKEPDGFAWPLNPGTDIVLQLHMRHSGKEEAIQSEIGLFFTDRPPTQTPFKILLTSRAIDIPAGTQEYAVNDALRMPCDIDVLAVLPHAHYLSQEMQSFATLPDGTQRPLLWIKKWDFNWQSDYRYAKPVFLPKGSTISMSFKYDNSTNNTRNPQQPPKRVTYGPQTTDEMAELWFQILPRQRNDLSLLIRSFQDHMLSVVRGQHELALRLDASDARAHSGLGQTLLGFGQRAEAARHLRRAIELMPDFDEPHFYLGYILRAERKLAEAEIEYRQVIRLSPTNHEAYGNLGLVLMEKGELVDAAAALSAALSMNPNDAVARKNLAIAREAMRSRGQK